MQPTVVTCYYRLPSKHPHASYEAWIDNFMSLAIRVVIFTNKESAPFLMERYPPSSSRTYNLLEFEEFENAKYDWEKEMALNRKPHAGHSPRLFLLWSEKVHFVHKAIEANPYKSDTFVWMDIGCVRDRAWLPSLTGFPNVRRMDPQRMNFLQVSEWRSDDSERATTLTHTHFNNRFPVLGGTMFGGSVQAWSTFRKAYMQVVEEADRNGVFKGEDQDLYSFVAFRNPDSVKLYPMLNVGYDAWFSLHLHWSNALRIHIVGPGMMPIPPTGWGAVEILIWDMATRLRALGHLVKIHNSKDLGPVVESIKAEKPDFVHIQYDDYAHIAPAIAPHVGAVAITSHFGYLEQPARWEGYRAIFNRMISVVAPNIYHFVLSEGIRQVYLAHGVPADRVFVTPNGADESAFRFTHTPAHPERSLVVGKIERRKGQWRTQSNSTVWYAGNRCDNSFDYGNPRWLGEWDKPTLYNKLTDYGNLVLLSVGEADPLVVKEALLAGLGVVVSAVAAANLDTSQPFITIIPQDKLDDAPFVAKAIEANRTLSVAMRPAIKKYSEAHTWTRRVSEFVTRVSDLLWPPATVKPTAPSHAETYFAQYPELACFKEFKQIVLWGFPLHSHTHSYIHGAWVKTFQALGLKTVWYHDKEYPVDFDGANSLFITEGWADNNIPLHPSSTYFVHIAKNPAKYLNAGARLIEIRYSVEEIHDYNYDYKLPENPVYLSKDTLYEVVPDDSAVAGRRGRPVAQTPYEAVYMYWATDLLPHEFNYEDASRKRENVNYFMGSLNKDHPFYSYKTACERQGVRTQIIDPWAHPVSFEENIQLMKRSFATPDFRSPGTEEARRTYGPLNGTNHLDIGYIPCRVFKSISYGQTGITNSKRVKALLGPHVHYVGTPAEAYDVAVAQKDNVAGRMEAMKYVAEHHTFIQRARDLARALRMKTAPTLVSALYDIGREAVDGRSMDKYITWTQNTLQQMIDPIVFYLDKSLGVKERLLNIRHDVGPIKIIETDLSDLDMYKYTPAITCVQANHSYMKNQTDIVNRLPAYAIIQYNKFAWLHDASHLTPSQSFVWMDAGCWYLSRSTDLHKYVWSGKPLDRFTIKVDGSPSRLDGLTPDNYIGTNTRILCGETFACPRGLLTPIQSMITTIWEKEMLEKNRLDTEQVALGLAYNANTELFTLCESVFDSYFSCIESKSF
jgi:hypothetical protein